MAKIDTDPQKIAELLSRGVAEVVDKDDLSKKLQSGKQLRIKLGIDPTHFGILITVNMEIGLCHPPVGLNLYVASGIAKIGISELTVAVLPWLLTMLVFLVIVTYWPGLSLWLPNLLGM